MKKYVVIGVILLFVITSVTPLVIGYNTEIKDVDNELTAELANLRYLCTLQMVLMVRDMNIAKKSY